MIFAAVNPVQHSLHRAKYGMQTQALIDLALRQIGVIAAGQSPTPNETADALAIFKALFRRWINEGAFGALKPVTPTANYTANANERIFRNSADVTAITIPELICGQPPRDLAVVVINDAFTGETLDVIYDGQVSRWCRLDTLGASDFAPLAFRDSTGLASALALELASQYGQEAPASVQTAALRFQAGLVTKYAEAREQVRADFF